MNKNTFKLQINCEGNNVTVVGDIKHIQDGKKWSAIINDEHIGIDYYSDDAVVKALMSFLEVHIES